MLLCWAIYELPLKNISSYPTKHIAIECNTWVEHNGTGSEYTDSPLQEFVNFSDIGCFANIRCLFVVNFAMNTNESFRSTRQKKCRGEYLFDPTRKHNSQSFHHHHHRRGRPMCLPRYNVIDVRNVEATGRLPIQDFASHLKKRIPRYTFLPSMGPQIIELSKYLENGLSKASIGLFCLKFVMFSAPKYISRNGRR